MKTKSRIELAGAWSDMSDEETEEIKNKIKKISKSSTKNLIKKFGHNKNTKL
jgi:hypothetical protein